MIERHRKDPGKREAQRILAREVCQDIFGKELTEEVIKISRLLFEEETSQLTAEQLLALKDGLPTVRSQPRKLVDLLVENTIVSSRRVAKEFILQGAISVDSKRVDSLDSELDFSIFKNVSLIKVGKRDFHLVVKE